MIQIKTILHQWRDYFFILTMTFFSQCMYGSILKFFTPNKKITVTVASNSGTNIQYHIPFKNDELNWYIKNGKIDQYMHFKNVGDLPASAQKNPIPFLKLLLITRGSNFKTLSDKKIFDDSEIFKTLQQNYGNEHSCFDALKIAEFIFAMEQTLDQESLQQIIFFLAKYLVESIHYYSISNLDGYRGLLQGYLRAFQWFQQKNNITIYTTFMRCIIKILKDQPDLTYAQKKSLDEYVIKENMTSCDIFFYNSEIIIKSLDLSYGIPEKTTQELSNAERILYQEELEKFIINNPFKQYYAYVMNTFRICKKQ